MTGDVEFKDIHLKPCPFCGSDVSINRYGGTSVYFIRCSKCWLKIEDGFAPTRMPAKALADFFNRRVNKE